MELLYCAGDAKSLWLFWKGILFLHSLRLAGQRPLLGGGRGGMMQSLAISVSGGCRRACRGGDLSPQPSPLPCADVSPWM